MLFNSLKYIIQMRNQIGQSLLELMVSVVIITVALAGIIAIFPYVIQKNVGIQTQSKTAHLAQNEWERLRALRYYDQELDALGTIEGMTVIKAVDSYLVRVTVRYIDPKTGLPPEIYPGDISEDTGLKEITVSVKRKDNIGNQTNLVTYFSKSKSGKG